MVNHAEAVRELLHDQLLPQWGAEKKRVENIDTWYRENPEPVKLPRDATAEHKYLAGLSRTPWLNLVVSTVSQTLFLERLHSASRTPEEMEAMWAPWQRNKLHSGQIPLHRAALAYGLAYTLTLPGDTGAVITRHSPQSSIAVYGDPIEDEYPQFFVREIVQKKAKLYRVVDDEAVHYLSVDNQTDRVEYIDSRYHNMGFCPVVKYSNNPDLEGETVGEVEPLIPLVARMNKTTYDRLLVQHNNSWKIITATGLEEPSSEEERRRAKLKLRQDDILTGEAGVDFGTLDETVMDPFVKAHDSEIEELSAVSQTPLTVYKMVNISADGLAEARASLYAKRGERQLTFGDSHIQTLRVASVAENREKDADDYTIQPYWADTEVRTMNQAVDALGKAAVMLGVPPHLLWDRIPSVDYTTAQSWRKYAEENPEFDEDKLNLEPNLG